MKERHYTLYISDMLETIARIESYIGDLDYDDFIQNNMVRDAVLRNLEVIGEAAKNIPDDLKEKYPDIP